MAVYRLPSRAASSAIYAAQTYWEIDPDNGSDADSGGAGFPLKTWAEYRRRVGSAAAPAGLEIKLLASLPADDPLRPPYVGATSTLWVHADMSVLHSGTFTTGVVTGAPTSGSGVRTKVVDSALSGAPVTGGFATYVKKLIAITAGARSGSTAIIAKDTGSKTAEVPYFQNNISVFPNVFGGDLIDPQVGDAYEVRDWAVTVGAVEFDQPVVDDGTTKILFEGLSFFSNPRFGSSLISGGSIALVNCEAINARGRFTAIASHILNLHAQGGDFIYMFGCLGSSLVYVDDGAVVQFDGGTSCEACQLFVAGTCYTCLASLYDAVGDGAVVMPGGTLQSMDLGNGYTEKLYGSGSSGGGVRVRSDGALVYGTKPSVTGSTPATNDCIVGGTNKAWSAIPFINTSNNAIAVAIA